MCVYVCLFVKKGGPMIQLWSQSWQSYSTKLWKTLRKYKSCVDVELFQQDTLVSECFQEDFEQMPSYNTYRQRLPDISRQKERILLSWKVGTLWSTVSLRGFHELLCQKKKLLSNWNLKNSFVLDYPHQTSCKYWHEIESGLISQHIWSQLESHENHLI